MNPFERIEKTLQHIAEASCRDCHAAIYARKALDDLAELRAAFNWEQSTMTTDPDALSALESYLDRLRLPVEWPEHTATRARELAEHLRLAGFVIRSNPS